MKTYLQSTISQSKLTSLATSSMEMILRRADLDVLIREFADRNVRKVKFNWILQEWMVIIVLFLFAFLLFLWIGGAGSTIPK